MVIKKRKYAWRKSVEEPIPEPEKVFPVEEKSIIEKPEEKVVLCDCGNPANPGDHQCWRCSHRT